MDLAERHGVQVMLCIQDHGPFSREANSEWDDNPYNAVTGGAATLVVPTFTRDTALRLERRREDLE